MKKGSKWGKQPGGGYGPKKGSKGPRFLSVEERRTVTREILRGEAGPKRRPQKPPT